MSEQEMIASVDLGSNSFRLQVCENRDGRLYVVDSLKEMVRFAAGLDDRKMLDKESRQRALSCLAVFGQRLRGFSADRVRAVATNTFRVAKNIGDFMPEAEAALGFPIDIIAGREEARLIYTGVVHTLPPNGDNMLVVDIGGGSTEFVIGSSLNPVVTESLNLGCVTYSMRFFSKGKADAKSFQAAVHAARSEIQRIGPELKQKGWQFAVGTSGTARAIRDVTGNDEGIFRDALQKIVNKLLKAGSVKKVGLEGLKSDRAGVFAGGLAVMTAVFEELDIDKMTVTDAALRDGVFYDMIGRELGDDMRDQTVADFQKRYGVDVRQACRVADTADAVFLSLIGTTDQTGKQTTADVRRQYIRRAAALHEIGLSVSHTGYHKHAAYILNEADMPGFSRREQHILAELVLGHRGDLRKVLPYTQEDPDLWTALLALRMAALLCRARTDVQLPKHTEVRYEAAQKRFVFAVDAVWLHKNPLTAATLEQESALWKKAGLEFFYGAPPV